MWSHILTWLKLARHAATFTRTTGDDKILDGLIELVELYLAGRITEDKVLAALASVQPA